MTRTTDGDVCDSNEDERAKKTSLSRPVAGCRQGEAGKLGWERSEDCGQLRAGHMHLTVATLFFFSLIVVVGRC